jgi:3',5'-cyclic-AMP phosphodiesterase
MELDVSHQMPLSKDDSLLLVQLTDSHLFADEDGCLLGVNTQDSLRQVVEQVQKEQPKVDLILATGDLAQDASPEAYTRFAALTAPLAAPICWTTGNHDGIDCMSQFCSQGRWLDPVADIDGWRIVMLHSAVPGAVHGELAPSQFQLLESALNTASERHVLICLHHHPIAMGSTWIDQIGLREPERLFGLIERFPNVRAVVWGHVHQAVDTWRDKVRLLATPSTCVQFAPGSEDFEVTKEAPGYRWLRLHTDGRIDTDVSRLADFSFELDYASGY